MSEGGEEEMRTTRANISHVDRQTQGLPCPFFQCIHGLFMQAEFRRMEERKMERGRLGDWKKEVENSMAGDHGAVELSLQGTLVFNPCPGPGDLLCFPSSLHDLEIRKRGLKLEISYTSGGFKEKNGVLVKSFSLEKKPQQKKDLIKFNPTLTILSFPPSHLSNLCFITRLFSLVT